VILDERRRRCRSNARKWGQENQDKIVRQRQSEIAQSGNFERYENDREAVDNLHAYSEELGASVKCSGVKSTREQHPSHFRSLRASFVVHKRFITSTSSTSFNYFFPTPIFMIAIHFLLREASLESHLRDYLYRVYIALHLQRTIFSAFCTVIM